MDWFTSDWHFFHSAIIKYCNRPYNNEQEMRNDIIRKYNKVVKNNDTVYVLGDLGMLNNTNLFKLAPILKKLHGTKHLILGNHDNGKPFTYEQIGFTTVHTALEYNDSIILRHDPSAANAAPKKLWLVGHVHNLFHILTEPIRCYNVGVDVNDFYPVNLEHIMEMIKNN